MLLEQFLTKWVKPAGKFRSLELCLSVLREQFLTKWVKPAGKFRSLELCLSVLREQFLTKWVKPAGKFRSLELCLSVLREQFLTRWVKPTGKFISLNSASLLSMYSQNLCRTSYCLSGGWVTQTCLHSNTDRSTLKKRKKKYFLEKLRVFSFLFHFILF